MTTGSILVNESEAALEWPISGAIGHLVTEEDAPADNLISEKQQRLLVLCLYSSPVACPFLAMANLGLFYALKQA